MGGLFDIDKLSMEKALLEKEINKDDFWNDLSHANSTYQHLKHINKILLEYQDILDRINISLELIDIETITDEELLKLNDDVLNLELDTLLSDEYDGNACYLEIHPGAGGTESCDWASMLLRMYERFLDKYNYNYKIVDKQDGDEAGIKSVTLFVEGNYPYGYLKNEKGVHRLVRISPFDSNKRRHTSFASVNVIPEFKQDINVEIKEDDLKIDVYHSSGAGGQSVNTSNSAVRITHLPTKLVVTCQTERSQLRNKETAIKMLKNKIYQQRLEEQEAEIKKINGDISNIDFGSQIRSYVLEPYKLVKDHRSNFESTDPLKVLDGEIKPFMESVLKIK